MATNHALLISVRPRFANAIFAGEKEFELRRVKPRLQRGDLVVVYASGSVKGMVGAFEVAEVLVAAPSLIWSQCKGRVSLSKVEFDSYFDGTSVGYAIRIGKLWPFEKTVTLNTLRKKQASFRPPQSYHYWNLQDLMTVGGEGVSSHLCARNPALTLQN